MTQHSPIPVLVLIRACAESNDKAAWEELVSRFHRAISLSVIRIARQWTDVPHQVVDDLVQETYLKLFADQCCLLHSFAQRHPEAIEGYIKTIACNVARDNFKARYSQKRGSGCDQDPLGDIDPAARDSATGSAAAMEREIVLREIDACLTKCTSGADEERDRTIFWLYYQQGMSAKAIAALPAIGLTAKGVESLILRLTRMVREQIAQVRVEPSEKEPGQKGFRPAESF